MPAWTKWFALLVLLAGAGSPTSAQSGPVPLALIRPVAGRWGDATTDRQYSDSDFVVNPGSPRHGPHLSEDHLVDKMGDCVECMVP